MRVVMSRSFSTCPHYVVTPSMWPSFSHLSPVRSHVAALRPSPGAVEVVGTPSGSLVAVVEPAVAGKKSPREAIREATRAAVVALRAKQASGTVLVDGLGFGDAAAALEGALDGSYSWSLQTTAGVGAWPLGGDARPLAVRLLGGASDPVVTTAAAAQADARTLANTPANLMTPQIFCERVGKMAQEAGLEVRVEGVEGLKRLRMGGVLAVGGGSDEEPRLMVLQHRGREGADFDVALVGKGVTFDSGGISIKPAANMGDMKGDMSGGASVAMATIALARLRSQCNVVAIIPLVENMPSGKALKPGDVYVARNGLTVEVDNTDAEGRLILADALHFAATEFKPRWLLDVATLTGAIHVALGDRLTGLFSNDDELAAALIEAGSATGQLMWRMPLLPHFADQMKGGVSDVINAAKGGRGGGSCTAAGFLSRFVADHPRWAHLDIAGTMMAADKSMTGGPTRALVRFVLSRLNASV